MEPMPARFANANDHSALLRSQSSDDVQRGSLAKGVAASSKEGKPRSKGREGDGMRSSRSMKNLFGMFKGGNGGDASSGIGSILRVEGKENRSDGGGNMAQRRRNSVSKHPLPALPTHASNYALRPPPPLATQSSPTIRSLGQLDSTDRSRSRRPFFSWKKSGPAPPSVVVQPTSPIYDSMKASSP